METIWNIENYSKKLLEFSSENKEERKKEFRYKLLKIYEERYANSDYEDSVKKQFYERYLMNIEYFLNEVIILPELEAIFKWMPWPKIFKNKLTKKWIALKKFEEYKKNIEKIILKGWYHYLYITFLWDELFKIAKEVERIKIFKKEKEEINKNINLEKIIENKKVENIEKKAESEEEKLKKEEEMKKDIEAKKINRYMLKISKRLENIEKKWKIESKDKIGIINELNLIEEKFQFILEKDESNREEINKLKEQILNIKENQLK